jgi:7-cyano-7-deazaguanine synthase
MKILVALSGGLDSAVVLASLVGDRHDCHAVGYDYGQPHAIELEYARKLAAHYSVPFEVEHLHHMPRVDDVVFAGRNLVLASAAVAKAHADGFDGVAFGCNASDWERFPDCRPAFWKAVQSAAETYDIKVWTPLLHSWKAEIAREAKRLGVPLDLTWSCYAPINGAPCGECLACTVRQKALQ